MVNVIMEDFQQYKLFPTSVFSFRGTGVKDWDLKEYFIKESSTSSNEGNWQGRADLHKDEMFFPLVDNIIKATKAATEGLKYDNNGKSYGYEITNMWGNILRKGQAHPPHTHSNNFWSGVYYITGSQKQSGIQFFDPRPQSQVLLPQKKEDNIDNGNLVSFPSAAGHGYVFPSWLVHWVPVQQDDELRISIAWNIVLRGEYGAEKDYQYARI